MKDPENCPSESKERALGGKTVMQAFHEALRKLKRPVEQVKDQDLALILADHIIQQMKRLGASHSTGKGYREPDTHVPSAEGHIRL